MKIGDKVNCWTVISTDAPPEHRYHLLCRCVCGSEKWVSRSALRRGKSKSCGCQKHRNRKKYILKPGDNVGYWTILSNDGDKFRCRCICGTERVIKHNILKMEGLYPAAAVVAIIRSKNKKKGANWGKKSLAKYKNTGYL